MAVKIKKIGVYKVELPLNKSFRVSGGRLLIHKTDSIIISIETDDGIVGWGESAPFGSAYLPAFAGAIVAGLVELGPVLLGENPLCIGQINHLMDLTLAGHPYIKSAIDMACWDILGKYSQQPLYVLLGGRFSENVALAGVISNDTAEKMVANMKVAREKGYRTFSAKIGGNVQKNLELVQSMISELEEDEKLTFDANRSWLPRQAIQVMNAVEDARILFEQPCETLAQCKIVSQSTHCPIILDECIHTFQDLLWAKEEGIAEGINIKIGRVGGITKARKMRDYCVETGLCMNIETTGGSIISGTAAVHLAVATPLRYRLANSDSTELHKVITAKGGYTFEKGNAIPTTAVGMGIEPDKLLLKEPLAIYC